MFRYDIISLWSPHGKFDGHREQNKEYVIYGRTGECRKAGKVKINTLIHSMTYSPVGKYIYLEILSAMKKYEFAVQKIKLTQSNLIEVMKITFELILCIR